MPIAWTYKNFTVSDSSKNFDLMNKLEDILPDFVKKTSDLNKPMLSLPAALDDLAEIESHARRISKNCTDVLVLGVGGSSLGGQALIQACNIYNESHPKIVFMSNLSSLDFPNLMRTLDPKNTHILAISKSGRTIEVHIQLALIMEWLKKSNLTFKDHITIITENKISPLETLIKMHNIPSLDHHKNLGGRFSVLSNVGLLPAAISGVKIRKVRHGAQEIIDEMIAARGFAGIPAAVGAAHIVSQQQQNNVSINVLFLYAERLKKFGEWYSQLWAESLGKKGGGTTPVIAHGPVDQHSQLQLYMDGPKDKSYSFITIGREKNTSITIPHTLDKIGMGYLSGKTLHDVEKSMYKGTTRAIRETGQPVRYTHMKILNEQIIGRLFMYFFLETHFAGVLMNIEIEGQQGVERGKFISKQFLKEKN